MRPAPEALESLVRSWGRRLSTFPRGSVVVLVLAAGMVFAQGQPSGNYGSLTPGEVRENVLAAATADALVYHTYTVTVPAGIGSLTIAVDGMGNDIDLALEFGSEISSYDEAGGDYDYLDFSEEPNPSYTVANPPAGVLYIDVVNLVDRPAAYRLSVIAQGQAASPPPPATNPLDPFVGTFAGDGLTLRLVAGENGYQGELEFQGQRYPVVTAQRQGDRLTGTFISGWQAFPFEATLWQAFPSEATPGGDLLTFVSGGASYRLERQASSPADTPTSSSPTPPSAPTPPAAAVQTGGLEGKWNRQLELGFSVTEYTLYFLPDGRYFYLESGDVPVQEEGRYAVNGDQITFQPFCSAAYAFAYRRSGDQLEVIVTDELGESVTFAYQLEPGSPSAVLQEIAAVDAERAAYQARTPVGRVQPGPTPLDVSLPNDPAPDRYVADATVFSEGELYTYFSAYTYVMDHFGQLQTVTTSDIVFNTPKMATLNYSRGEYRDTGIWRFTPNGRAMLRFETYWNAADLSTNPITPHVEVFWGRYRIDGNSIFVETDAGEQLTLELLFGRRTLRQGETCFDEIEWVTERLQQETQQIQEGN